MLVNNAGIGMPARINGPDALKVFDTNVVGIVRVTQAALPLLRKSDNPLVVNVSSALGSFWAVTNPERPAFRVPAIVYGASKAAVSMLTLQYAKAVPEIKFNAVEPGFTATDLTPFSGGRRRPVEAGRRGHRPHGDDRQRRPLRAPSRRRTASSPGSPAIRPVSPAARRAGGMLLSVEEPGAAQ